jgi:hypothetical protein
MYLALNVKSNMFRSIRKTDVIRALLQFECLLTSSLVSFHFLSPPTALFDEGSAGTSELHTVAAENSPVNELHSFPNSDWHVHFDWHAHFGWHCDAEVWEVCEGE